MRRFAAALLLALALTPGTVSAHGEAPRAAHGGLMQEAQALWVELVVKGTDVAVYVVDHDHKPVPAAQVSGTATVLVGGQSYKVELNAAGDCVQGRLPAPVTGNVVATVALKVGGKAVSARFTGKA
ncbi:adenylosuccinate synthase [Methylobacterium isbiliense]|uniref:adenylosuccinate synthase n=1 Tax=Methylobacterium isbiliense TaxID=315478 RepID=UPI0025B2926D|nr:adenylosuccinate synthase [Methylobacterium isbiliense]MDN3626863.1 adenylosuccinate synthase [Methylobacterium isbiliense]